MGQGEGFWRKKQVELRCEPHRPDLSCPTPPLFAELPSKRVQTSNWGTDRGKEMDSGEKTRQSCGASHTAQTSLARPPPFCPTPHGPACPAREGIDFRNI